MIEKDDISNKLTEIFRAELDDPSMTLSASDSMNAIPAWDSLAHIRILTAVESTFGFSFDISEMEQVTTVEKIMAAIQDRVNS